MVHKQANKEQGQYLTLGLTLVIIAIIWDEEQIFSCGTHIISVWMILPAWSDLWILPKTLINESPTI